MASTKNSNTSAQPMPWFRLYHEIVDDAKIKLLAFEDRWHFIALLCCKRQGILNHGNPDLMWRLTATKLGLTVNELGEVARRLAEVGLVDKDTLQPTNWDKRQPRSDSSAQRVKKYRDKRLSSGLPKSSSAYLKYWDELMARDGGECVYCGSTDNLCIDHMLPITQGGDDNVLNLCIACKACNSGKSGRTPEQAGYKIRNSTTKQCFEEYLARVTVTVTP